MIRVRTVEGKAFNMAPSARFVEIRDESGKVAAVVFQNDNGHVRIISAEDAEFYKYLKSYKLKPSIVVDHED
jgi:hypothetical protein